MSMYKYVRDAWKRPSKDNREIRHDRLIEFRRQPATLRVIRPTRIDRARSLGYRAKQGFIIVRQRVKRGGHYREQFKAGRRPKAFSRRKIVNASYQRIAEERVARQYTNCEVLNSYYVVKDGNHYWYEVILVDRTHPAIINDTTINWISLEKNRVFRGKTSAGKKSRGLRNKGVGAEKVRPTQKSNKNRLH